MQLYNRHIRILQHVETLHTLCHSSTLLTSHSLSHYLCLSLCLSSAAKGHEATFDAVEAVLRERYPDHILPPSQREWIFVNAGGWMGAMYILHASLTEYVLFFGTAVDTSGHSGRCELYCVQWCAYTHGFLRQPKSQRVWFNEKQ